MEGGGGVVLDKLMEAMAVMGEQEREKMMKLFEVSVPEELRKMGIEGRKAGIDRMVEEKTKKMEVRRKVELIKEGTWRKFFKAESGPGRCSQLREMRGMEVC